MYGPDPLPNRVRTRHIFKSHNSTWIYSRLVFLLSHAARIQLQTTALADTIIFVSITYFFNIFLFRIIYSNMYDIMDGILVDIGYDSDKHNLSGDVHDVV